MKKNISSFEKIIGVKFKNQNLLLQSLTHKSNNPLKNNEKLDAIPRAPEVNIIGKSMDLDNIKNKNVDKTDRIILKDINKNKNFSEPKVKEISTEGKEKFREINFSYPQWTPGEDENNILENKPLSSRIKYLEIENSSKKGSINFNV